MDASEPPMSTAPRTTESMLGRGPRSRKRPSREELLAKPAEGARVPSSTAAGKELSFNNRNLNSGNFLAPTTTATAVAEQTSLLSRVPFVGKCLVEGTVVAFVVLILAVMACLPCRWRPAPSPDPSPDPSHKPSRGPGPVVTLAITPGPTLTLALLRGHREGTLTAILAPNQKNQALAVASP